MIEQKSGHIFNMCSIAALKAYANGGAYSISKFALAGFSKNLREEMKPYGIKVQLFIQGCLYRFLERPCGPETDHGSGGYCKNGLCCFTAFTAGLCRRNHHPSPAWRPVTIEHVFSPAIDFYISFTLPVLFLASSDEKDHYHTYPALRFPCCIRQVVFKTNGDPGAFY